MFSILILLKLYLLQTCTAPILKPAEVLKRKKRKSKKVGQQQASKFDNFEISNFFNSNLLLTQTPTSD
jgi:hypothetical protein